jgi:O-antigen ligase
LLKYINLDKQEFKTNFTRLNLFSSMKLTPIKDWFSAPLLIPGLIFLFVNTSTSHMFYHVNSYKIVLVILGVTFFAFRNIPFFPTTTDDQIPWKIWGIIAIPLLATFPGLIWHQWSFNYNFRYELATNLVLLLWVVYLYRNVRQEDDLRLFIFFIGITVIYNGCWSILERTGLHPIAWQEPVQMVKATFGHRNYFSGFLIILLPTLLIFAIPETLFQAPAKIDSRPTYTRIHRFYATVFLFGSVSLLLAQTRAAIAAFLLSLALVSYLYVHFFAPRYWRQRILIFYGVGIIILASLTIVIYANPGLFKESRFAQLFTLQAWLGRLLPWQTAINSIKSSPWVGFGLGSSYNLFFSFVDPDAKLFHFEDSYNHAHSEILEYVQESGLIGLIAFTIFWIYLIYLLIRLLRSSSTSTTQIKLGIGIAGGFLAYHIHGSFSVAPRMMVMKLPIYTLIALILILNKIHLRKNLAGQSAPVLRNRMISGLPTLAVLIVIWTIFLPWIAGQYHYIRIQNHPPSYIQTGKLEELVRLTPDIYALDKLSRLQIKYHKNRALKNTLDTIERIIPHYRDLDYKKTLHAAMDGNLEEAKRLGLISQQHDRYHLPTIDILINLSLQSDDLQLFKKQFELLLRQHVFSQNLIKSLHANDVLIQFVPLEEPLKISSQKNRLVFQWSEKLLGLLFEIARKNQIQKHDSVKERQRYGAYLFQLLAKRPYFQLKVRGPYKSESLGIQNAVKAYYSLENEWKGKKKKLEFENRAELRRTLPTDRRTVYTRQNLALKTMQLSYNVKLNVFAQELKEKTDWDIYTKKQKFITRFINQFISIIFPASR